jgi:hypothetical protein
MAKRVLYVIACGGRPASDLPTFVQRMQACVVGTPSAMKFLDASRLADLTGYPVRSDYKRPEEPDVLPSPDALVVAPATFNTINKWAAGISDTLALGLLNEAIGLGLPIVAVPTANVALVRHPAFLRSVDQLRAWGVHVLFDPERYPLPTPNMGAPGAALFPWEALFDEVTSWAARGASKVR